MPKLLNFIGPFPVVLLSAALVSTAQAQTTVQSVELGRLVEEGDRVRIVRANGTEIVGDLGTVGPAALDVEVDGRMVRLHSADVREVALSGLGAGLAAGAGTAALAQEALTRTEPMIPADAAIFVFDDQGKEHRGTFLRLNDDDLLMVIDGQEHTFGRNAITRIERPGDSLKNGAQIGAIVGLTLGLLQALTVGDMRALPINLGFYTAIGIGVDAAYQGRTLVYQRDAAAPVRQQGAAALAFAVRW